MESSIQIPIRMIPTNVIYRIFQIRWNDRSGTCFTIDVDGKQYLCTARHCLRDFDSGQIKIFHEGTWKNLGVELVGFGSNGTEYLCTLARDSTVTILASYSYSRRDTLGSRCILSWISIWNSNRAGRFQPPLSATASEKSCVFRNDQGRRSKHFALGMVITILGFREVRSYSEKLGN